LKVFSSKQHNNTNSKTSNHNNTNSKTSNNTTATTIQTGKTTTTLPALTQQLPYDIAKHFATAITIGK
jgi:hypothetical protein